VNVCKPTNKSGALVAVADSGGSAFPDTGRRPLSAVNSRSAPAP